MSTPSFKDSFVAVGRETISKERNDYVYSVGVAVTALMVLAGAVYFWTPIASIVVLICAIILIVKDLVGTPRRGRRHDAASADAR